MTFKPIKGYEGIYWINNDGDIKNKSGRILKSHDNGLGYYKVVLYKNKQRHYHYVHRLVAQTFLRKTDKTKHEIDHIDRNRQNCHSSNLRYVNKSENAINRDNKSLAKNLRKK